MTKLTGVLLVNTGSPDSPDIADVRVYLGQFLMDGGVLDMPWPLRKLEVGQAGRKTFLAAGGQSFALIPALNDQPRSVAALEQLIKAG